MASLSDKEMEKLLETVDYLKKMVGCARSEGAFGHSTAASKDEQSNAEIVKMIQELKKELDEFKEQGNSRQSPSPDNKGGLSQFQPDNRASSTGIMMAPTKGGNAPAGMTPEQLAEFKKQTLQINALQQKLKDVEAKLSDAVSAIKKGNERTSELVEQEQETTKDIYSLIDNLTNTLSEKIAQQRVEVQKIADDQPKPINYDPFNYGEAYGGDLVDFQARKRIIEIKLLLQGLQITMNQMRESVKVSPKLDLGYKVVRLDELVGQPTGFDAAYKAGQIGTDQAMLVSQSSSRQPDKVHFPRTEAFKTDEDQASQWAITDSIMQTMYRLESEVGSLQSIVKTSDLSATTKALEEVNTSLCRMKDSSVDIATVKNLIQAALASQNEDARAAAAKDNEACNRSVNSAQVDHLETSLRSLAGTMEYIAQKVYQLESALTNREGSATMKTQAKGANCLSCDRDVDIKKRDEGPSLPFNDFFGSRSGSRNPPTSLRYLLNREYELNINNEIVDVYNLPRPCGAGYVQRWPQANKKEIHEHHILEAPPMACVDKYYIVGHDGRIYHGDKDKKTEKAANQGQGEKSGRGLSGAGIKCEVMHGGQRPFYGECPISRPQSTNGKAVSNPITMKGKQVNSKKDSPRGSLQGSEKGSDGSSNPAPGIKVEGTDE